MASRTTPAVEQDADDRLRVRFDSAVLHELTDDGRRSLAFDNPEEGEAAEIEIESQFQQKMLGARYLPRRDRPHAIRAAKEWRAAALSALRERRASDRHARHLLRRLLAPVPG